MKLSEAVFILIQWHGNVMAQLRVLVCSANEFYNAIASNTTIILASGDYHLEKTKIKKMSTKEFFRMGDEYEKHLP